MRLNEKLGKYIPALIGPHRAAIHFIFLFVILLSLFFGLFYLFEDSFHFLRLWTAEITGFFAQLFGIEITVSGTSLHLKTITLEIIQECTGLYAIMIFGSCILAYPASWEKKGIGIILGLPVIFGINLIRVLVLVYTGEFHPDIFDYVHYYFWQSSFIIIVILTFLLWIDKIVYHDT